MVLFRCTQRVLKRFRVEPLDQPPRSSGLLGDWYANRLNAEHARFVLCLNERALLPVIVPARKSEFPAAFPATLQPILAALGIAPELTEAEVEVAQRAVFGRTESRVVLGVLKGATSLDFHGALTGNVDQADFVGVGPRIVGHWVS